MTESNPNSRLEAFCDGVFAFALTLLIIDIRIPASTVINTTDDVWTALQHLGPSVFTFVLSFTIILITWVNHHGALKQVNKSSPAFIYANGFLLLTVVFMPFPTALMGDQLFTNHATPSVMLFNVVMALQALGWILMTGAAIKDRLTISDAATAAMRQNRKFGVFAVAGYSVFALLAFWFPLVIAILITAIWAFWLIYGINMKQE